MPPTAVSEPASTLRRDLKATTPLSKPGKKNNTVVILIAVVIVVLIASSVFRMINNRPVAANVVTIIGAGKPLPPGHKIGYNDLHAINIPPAYKSPEMAVEASELVGKTTRTFLPVGEPILMSQLLPGNKTLGEVLGPNQRALTLKLSDEQMVDHAVQPGDLVDVICTTIAPDGKRYTKTVAQSLLVLMSVPKEMMVAERVAASGADKITVAVGPDEAEVLSQAIEVAKMRIVLRNKAVRTLTALPGADDSDLLPHEALRIEPPTMKMPEAPALPPPPPPPLPVPLPQEVSLPAAAQWVVDVFKGSSKESHAVNAR